MAIYNANTEVMFKYSICSYSTEYLKQIEKQRRSLNTVSVLIQPGQVRKMKSMTESLNTVSVLIQRQGFRPGQHQVVV